MKVSSLLAGSTEFSIEKAVLIYSGQTSGGSRVTIATMHGVTNDEKGVPQLGPGTCVRPDNAQELALRLLEQTGEMEMLPTEVLAMSVKGIAWHCPRRVRQLWFAPQDKEDAKLKGLSGELFPQPHLLFLGEGDREFRVFALQDKGRPTAKSPLFQAPYYNVSPTGHLCVGSAKIPPSITPSVIAKAEKAFFESNFTHSNAHGGKLTLHQGGHLGLWSSLKGRRKFPDHLLAPLYHGKRKLTLGDVL